MPTNYFINFWLSLFVFCAHIVVNLIIRTPNQELFSRLEKLTLFPPGWVFGIWIIIWGLQFTLFYQTFGSEFWNNSMTLFFILICIGNVGSQYAGANNWGWQIYIALIICMFVNSVLFMENASVSYLIFSVAKSATQLYVGWASLAFLIGVGVILVTDQQIVSDKIYTIVGSIVLAVVPIVIWILWFKNRIDYRVVTIPYFIVYFAFAVRLMQR